MRISFAPSRYWRQNNDTAECSLLQMIDSPRCFKVSWRKMLCFQDRLSPANKAWKLSLMRGDLLGWARSLLTWVKGWDPHDWQTAPSTPDPIPNTLRVAILGDWGTGLY